MFKIALNPRKPYNYAFFCPVSKLHLTVSNPVGFAHEVTPAIFKGLKGGTLIDVDGVIDMTTGQAKEAAQEPSAPLQNESPAPSEPLQTQGDKEPGEKKRRGRKAAQTPVEEVPNDLFDGITE